MSETLEERIRRHATEDRDNLIGYYSLDIVELLDARDARLTAIEMAVRELVNNLPEFEIELARENWGNTNTRIILEKRAALAALLDKISQD